MMIATMRAIKSDLLPVGVNCHTLCIATNRVRRNYNSICEPMPTASSRTTALTTLGNPFVLGSELLEVFLIAWQWQRITSPHMPFLPCLIHQPQHPDQQ